jgi:hypothetical protein
MIPNQFPKVPILVINVPTVVFAVPVSEPESTIPDKIASKIPTLIPSTPNALTSFPIDSRLDILILGFGNYSE